MDKKDVSIIEIIEKMIGEGEPDERIIKTLKDLGVPEEKAEKLIRIAQADTFSLLRREVKKIVEQQLEQEKPVLKKFIEDEAMSAATETRNQVTKAVISDLKEYEQDITGQSVTFQEQIRENVGRVNELSEKVKVKLNELGDAVRAIQTGKVGPLSPDDVRALQTIKAQMGQLNETVRQVQTMKSEARQLGPLTDELKQLQDVKNRMNTIADALKQIQSRPPPGGADMAKQLQDMRAKIQDVSEWAKQAQGARTAGLSGDDARQMQAIRAQMGQLNETVRQMQASKAEAKQLAPIAEEVRQVQEIRAKMDSFSELLKQIQLKPGGQVVEQVKQMQEMKVRMNQMADALKQMQARPQALAEDSKPMHELRTRMSQMSDIIKQLQGGKLSLGSEDAKQLTEVRSRLGQMGDVIKQLEQVRETPKQLAELRTKISQMADSVRQVEPYKDQSKLLMDMRARVFEMNEKMKLLQSRAPLAAKPWAAAGPAPAEGHSKRVADILWGAGLVFGVVNLYFLYTVFGKPLSIDSIIVMTIMALLTITLLFVATEMQPEGETTLATIRPVSYAAPARK